MSNIARTLAALTADTAEAASLHLTPLEGGDRWLARVHEGAKQAAPVFTADDDGLCLSFEANTPAEALAGLEAICSHPAHLAALDALQR